jgi:protein-S-isoprenylcysteine O-methyltransferase Ste14
MFFLPAGTFDYWEAWVYLAVLFVPMSMVLIYLYQKAPDLLERRMKVKEEKKEQNKLLLIAYPFFVLAYLLPGFDRRFEWSHVPIALVIVADVLVLLGYGFFFLVLRENRYASRVVEVEKEQRVITSGPYVIVRHPMYLGLSILYLFTPLALGSYWGMIPASLIIPILVARIWSEERILVKELKGYAEYMHKTKYRYIPGIW